MRISCGYVLLPRQIIEDEIMRKPPLYLKVWLWLLLKAQHKPYKSLNRGELVTSISEIQEAMSYYSGFRKVKPSKKEIWSILEWLRNPHGGNTEETMAVTMVETTKVTHGLRVNIVGYCVFQDPVSYGGNDGGNDGRITEELWRKQQGNNKNNNDNNDKNDKNNINNINIMSMDIEDKQTKRTKKNDKAELMKEFEEWWKDYPRRDARKEAEAKYIATRRKGATKEELEKAKQNYIRYLRANGTEKRYIMLGRTFLGPNERWKDWLNDIEVASLVVGSGMAPVSSQSSFEQEEKEIAMFGGDEKKWWAWKKKQLQQ